MVLKYGSASSASVARAPACGALLSSAGRSAFTCADAAPASNTLANSINTHALSKRHCLKISTCSVIAPPVVARPASLGSTRAPAKKHNANRLEDNDGVQHQRLVLNVVEIILQLFDGIFERRAVRVANLRPAGQSGLHQMALRIVTNLFFKPRDEDGAFGSRPRSEERRVGKGCRAQWR